MGVNRYVNFNAITRMGKLLIGASLFTVVGITGTVLTVMDTIETGKSSKCTLVEIHDGNFRNVLDISCENLQKSQKYLYIARNEETICRISEDSKIECIEIPLPECNPSGSLAGKSSRSGFSVEDDTILVNFHGPGTGAVIEVQNGKILQHCTDMMDFSRRFGNIFIEIGGDYVQTYNLRTQQQRQRRLTEEHFSRFSHSVHQDSNGRIWAKLETDSEFLLYGDNDDKPTTIDIKKKFEELCGNNCSEAPLFGYFHKDSFHVFTGDRDHPDMNCNLATESCSRQPLPLKDITEAPEEDMIKNENNDPRLVVHALHPLSGKEYGIIKLENTTHETLDPMWIQMSKDYYAMAGYFFLAGTILLVIGHVNNAMRIKARRFQNSKSHNDPKAD